MLWTMRLFIFAIALTFGAGCWYVFTGATAAQAINTNGNTNGGRMVGNMNGGTASGAEWTPAPPNATGWHGHQGPEAREEGEEEVPTLAWAEPSPVYGHAVAPRVTLRSEPNASSNVVATLDAAENESVEITDSTRDFLRVKFAADVDAEGGTRQQDYEGWAEWGAVVPYTSAVVVEASSGEVVGRVALGYGITEAAFSPDGSRAVFYGGSGADDHGEAQSHAYEVDTEGYKVLRTFKTSTSGGFASILYDDEGDLRPLLQTYQPGGGADRKSLHPFRVKGDLFERAGDALRSDNNGLLLISRDGASGFDVHVVGDSPGAVRVDVIDLKNFAVRNSFRIASAPDEQWSYEYAASADGAEFFYRASGGSVRVVDTRTGLRLREIKPRVAQDSRAYLSRDGVAGDLLLLRYWEENEGEEGGQTRALWLKADGETAPAEQGIDNVFEAGGERYAVNEAGTRLFRLDGEGRIAARIRIARPESEHRPKAGEDFTVMGLKPSPDGKHVVIFFGIPDGC